MSNKITNYTDYKNYEGIPTADQITLKVIQDYFDNEIEPYTYIYDTEEVEKITLNFAFANFPHLIGTHYAANAKYGRNSEDAARFKGIDCYNEIKLGTIDKQTIKGIDPQNKDAYKDMTKKMRYFNKLHLVLSNPLAIYYNKDANGKRKNKDMDCDIILYTIIDNNYIHLGIDKAGKNFIPKTFLIDNKGEFITNQKEINIAKVTKVRRRRQNEILAK